MDTMETNVILKYKRLCDCWLCSDCACENMLTDNTCSVCGAYRTQASLILRAGDDEPNENFYPNPSAGHNPASGGHVLHESKVYHPPVLEEDSDSSIGLVVALILIVIAVIAIAVGILVYQ